MDLLHTVRSAWGFTGVEARSIIDQNAFGNLLLEDSAGQIWRIRPEELSCERVASSAQELRELRESPDFVTDWEMQRLVSLASSALGTPPEVRCFCMKIPAVLGGKYEVDNIGIITLSELISASGEAQQIKDVPDGAQIKLKIV